MLTKILSTGSIRNWRASLPLAEDGVAVITGSFAILQPGNLSAIRRARQLAGEVIVILEPATKFMIGGMDEGNDQRAEFLSFLGDVSSVCDPEGCPDFIEHLGRYTMVDCLAQASPSALRMALRRGSARIEDVGPLPGCFTEDVSTAIRKNLTPVSIPPSEVRPAALDLDRVSAWRRQGRKIATVNGCFDILHIGHAQMLAGARQKADELIVLVNDDASVRAYKGQSRPVFPIEFRLQALEAFESVSLAVAFSGDNPLDMLARLRPDIHVKGGTFERERVRAESELMESWGGKVEFCPLVEGYSTTELRRTAE